MNSLCMQEKKENVSRYVLFRSNSKKNVDCLKNVQRCHLLIHVFDELNTHIIAVRDFITFFFETLFYVIFCKNSFFFNDETLQAK